MTIGGAERQRLIFVDGPFTSPSARPEAYLAIAIRASDPASFNALVQASMPIIQSFRFK